MWDDILLYVIIGFVAQMIDGAIGMAYGVTASSVLLSLGVPPATASACVHAAETFTTGASGFAHWRLGNVDRKLLVRLAVPGMIGGAIGAYILSELPGETLRPFISAYLLLLGVFIVWKALATRPIEAPAPRAVAPLGLFGGALDAIGGGGWGPIVTSTLLGQGAKPRYAIGTSAPAGVWPSVRLFKRLLGGKNPVPPAYACLLRRPSICFQSKRRGRFDASTNSASVDGG